MNLKECKLLKEMCVIFYPKNIEIYFKQKITNFNYYKNIINETIIIRDINNNYFLLKNATFSYSSTVNYYTYQTKLVFDSNIDDIENITVRMKRIIKIDELLNN